MNKILLFVFLACALGLICATRDCHAKEEEYFRIITTKPTSLFEARDGRKIAWVNKGQSYRVIEQHKDWYLIETSFGKIKEAWIRASDAEEDRSRAIDLGAWEKVDILIHDKTGDVASPYACDIKSLKIDFNEDYIYFLLELAAAWGELFKKTRATDIIGTIYIDADGDKETGYTADTFFAHRNGSGERSAGEIGFEIGSEYKIDVEAGFQATIREDKITDVLPSIEYKLYFWDARSLSWQYLDSKKAAVSSAFIQLDISRDDIKLSDRQKISIILEEWNAVEGDRYNIAEFVLERRREE